MEQAAECIHSHRYCNDPSRCNFRVRCAENVMRKGDRVMGRVFEDDESNPEEACGEKKRPFEHVVELHRISEILSQYRVLRGHKHSLARRHFVE